ncbi:hypothetical protein KDE13_02780 [Campylobacter sp. faydin G-140]|uniref:hypothetical protein n=1 Tax=Campylobacter anatolicus TaxID=2829105 RepID=UPI001B9AE51C|nr:hypothetical protein [Campylobacter anatolicus]MBR8465287.1 hypothetical protein [Campylobacter anatolicus]
MASKGDRAWLGCNTSVVALHDKPLLRERLGIPPTHVAIGSLAIGKSDKVSEKREITKKIPTTFLR